MSDKDAGQVAQEPKEQVAQEPKEQDAQEPKEQDAGEQLSQLSDAVAKMMRGFDDMSAELKRLSDQNAQLIMGGAVVRDGDGTDGDAGGTSPGADVIPFEDMDFSITQ